MEGEIVSFTRGIFAFRGAGLLFSVFGADGFSRLETTGSFFIGVSGGLTETPACGSRGSSASGSPSIVFSCGILDAIDGFGGRTITDAAPGGGKGTLFFPGRAAFSGPAASVLTGWFPSCGFSLPVFSVPLRGPAGVFILYRGSCTVAIFSGGFCVIVAGDGLKKTNRFLATNRANTEKHRIRMIRSLFLPGAGLTRLNLKIFRIIGSTISCQNRMKTCVWGQAIPLLTVCRRPWVVMNILMPGGDLQLFFRHHPVFTRLLGPVERFVRTFNDSGHRIFFQTTTHAYADGETQHSPFSVRNTVFCQ